jgi:hypothetical protein
MTSRTRCALCNIMGDSLTKSAEPLTKGMVCDDCWPHVQRYGLRHAPVSIEVIRDKRNHYVSGEGLRDSDFENFVWTEILDVGLAE